MRKILILFIFICTLCLVSCDGGSLINNKKVKDYITSYENYNEAYILDLSTKRQYILSSEEYESIKNTIEYVYNSEARKCETNEKTTLNKEDEEKDFTLLTSPIPLPAVGMYELVIYNSNEKVSFKYINSEEKYNLFIRDSLKEIACEVLDNNAKNRFGNLMNSLFKDVYGTSTLFTEIHPIFNELKTEDVSKIEVCLEVDEDSRLNIKTHNYFENAQEINAYIELYKNAQVEQTSYEDIRVPGGTVSNMVIYMKDERKYEISFYQGCLVFNNTYYSIACDDIYIAPNRVDFSFNMKSLEGSLYNLSEYIGKHTLDLSKIKFVPSSVEQLFFSKYSLRTGYGTIDFMNNTRFRFNDVVYHVEEGTEEIDKLIEFAEGPIYHIEIPNILKKESLDKLVYIGLDTDISKTRVVSLNDYVTLNGESFSAVLGLDSAMSDEEIKEDYMLLLITRNAPIHNDFKKVEYYDAFIENGDLYITIQYSCKSTGAYDAALTTYVDYLLIPSAFGKVLYKNFDVSFNSIYTDNKYIRLNYEDVEIIKQTYKESGHYPKGEKEYKISILGAYGNYNGATVLLITNDGVAYPDVIEVEVVAGITFTYPNTNTMMVYYENNLYSLISAYNKGILSTSDIIMVYNYYSKR